MYVCSWVVLKNKALVNVQLPGLVSFIVLEAHELKAAWGPHWTCWWTWVWFHGAEAWLWPVSGSHAGPNAFAAFASVQIYWKVYIADYQEDWKRSWPWFGGTSELILGFSHLKIRHKVSSGWKRKVLKTVWGFCHFAGFFCLFGFGFFFLAAWYTGVGTFPRDVVNCPL